MSFEPEKAEPPAGDGICASRLRPGRAPLLWLLVPLVAGYVAADVAGVSVEWPWWVLCGAGLALAAPVALSGRSSRKAEWAWRVGFVAAVFALAVIRHGRVFPPPPDRASLPPREAILLVRVDELFQSAGGGVSGFGTVEEAPGHLVGMGGVRVQFRLSTPKGRVADPEIDLGARVRLRGVLENAPAGEGFARYLRQRGVGFTLSRARSEGVETPATAFRRACTRARLRVAEALGKGVEPEDAARLSALMLGRTGLLPAAERMDFRRAGATHLFAISGLHITGIAAGLVWFSRRLRIPDAPAMAVILGGLWLYVQMAGAPPSAMRAWVMAFSLFAATLAGRGARPVSGLVAAALLTLAADPSALRDPGFLLSYAVVAALLLYSAPLVERVDAGWRPWKFIPPQSLGRVRRWLLRVKRPVVSACAVSAGATVAGAPAAAALFGQVSFIGPAANLVLVPLSAPPVLLGFVSSALAVAGFGDLAGPCNAVAALFMRATAWCAHVASTLPGAAETVPPAPVWAAGLAVAPVVASLLLYPLRPDRSAWRFAVLPCCAALWFAVMAAVG